MWASIKREIYTPFVLMGRCSPCFLALVALLLGSALLPSILFVGVTFVLVPILFLGYAAAYYRWSISEVWNRFKMNGLAMAWVMLIYALPSMLFMWLLRAYDQGAYRMLMYPLPGNGVLTGWVEFCDKLPVEFTLVLSGFFLFWPVVRNVIQGGEKLTMLSLMDESSAIFSRITPPLWIAMGAFVVGFYFFWSLYVSSYAGSLFSILMIFALVFFTVLLSGWAFLFGLNMPDEHIVS